MPINFPSAPTVGQTYTFENKSWQYNGTAWVSISTTPIQGVQGIQGISGGGGTGGSGTQGTQGIQGIQGSLGLQGWFGFQGIQGPSGSGGGGGGASVTVSTTPPSGATEGNIWFESDTSRLYVYYDSFWIETTYEGIQGPIGLQGVQGTTGIQGTLGPTGTTGPKNISILAPTASENITLLFTTSALTVSKISHAIRGGTSATFTIRYDSTRSATGTEVVTGGTIANSTAGASVTTFNSASIPANSWVWLTTTAVSGTVNELAVTVEF